MEKIHPHVFRANPHKPATCSGCGLLQSHPVHYQPTVRGRATPTVLK